MQVAFFVNSITNLIQSPFIQKNIFTRIAQISTNSIIQNEI